jgi:hypothetical protein
MTTINFDEKSAELSGGEKTTLRSVVNAVRKDDKVQKVIVAAWSDRQLPNNNDAKLPEADQELAKQRMDAVAKALTEMGVGEVETYNMAENPNWMSDVFNTKDAQVKDVVRKDKKADETANVIGAKINEKGGPSKAVVIVVGENDPKSAH